MHIESGPTTERIVRTSLLVAMVVVFAIWFSYDGWIGYPKVNYKDHIDQFPVQEQEAVRTESARRVYENIQENIIPALEKALREPTLAEQKAAIEAVVGGPPSYETDQSLYYFGPAYRVKIPVWQVGSIKVVGQQTPKSRADILGQQVIAGVLGVFALGLIWFLLRVVRTRLKLDDIGLTFKGKGPIAWDDMIDLDTSRFNEKGWVDLIYNDHGTQRKLRLDEYHIARFEDVIDAICEKKGFENPLPVEEESPVEPTSEEKAT